MVTDHQGTPREIFSEGGQASWAGLLNTWGQMQFWRYREGKAENDPNYTECPFRFAGQYEDEESGLYYNRFRYYDRETGQYLSPDPIGLLGGLNPYGYVHCPTGWIDPFGLCGTSKLDKSVRPLESSNYSVWQQIELPPSLYKSSRTAHFRYANEQLYNAIKKDPQLASKLPPEVVAHVQPGPRGGFKGSSPPNHTWHHNAQDPTKIELTVRPQHQAPGPVQNSLHPNQEGGFKKLNDDY